MFMPQLSPYVWLILFVIFGSMAYAGMLAAPFVPTRRKDQKRSLDAAGIKPGDKVYDLGCGDGWFVCEAAKRGAQAVGFELALPAYAIALVRSWCVQGPGSVRIKLRDFWHANLSDADLVYVFLTPRVMPKLRAKLERECRPGTRVACYVFHMPDWIEKEKIKAPGRPPLYIYEVPKAATGRALD